MEACERLLIPVHLFTAVVSMLNTEEGRSWRTATSTTRNEFRNSRRSWKKQYCSEKNQIASLRR